MALVGFRRYGFVGVGVALLDEMCHGVSDALMFEMLKQGPVSLILLPTNPDVEL